MSVSSMKNLFFVFWGWLFWGIVLSPVMAETITYRGTSPSSLRNPQTTFGVPELPSAPGSLFPSSPSGNNVTVNANVSGHIYGGITATPNTNAENNIVVIEGGTIGNAGSSPGGNITGGWSLSGSASNNTVEIENNATVRGIIYGGWVRGGGGEASLNNVIINDSPTLRGNIYGGYSQGTGSVFENTVSMNGGYVTGSGSIIAGGYAAIGGSHAEVNNNHVVLENVTINNSDIYGGRGNTTGAGVHNNEVSITNGTIHNGAIYGGEIITGSGRVYDNLVTIEGGTINATIYGGQTGGSGDVTGNAVSISDAIVTSDIYGGYSARGTVADNIVTIGVSGIAGVIDFNGAVLGTSLLTKTGTGTLVLSSDRSVIQNGGVNIQEGTLQLGNGGTTGSVSTLGGFAINAGAWLAYDHSNNITETQAITGAGTVVQRGSGTLALFNVTNDFTGGMEIESGSLLVTDNYSYNNALGQAPSAGYITFTGADSNGAKNVIIDPVWPMVWAGGTPDPSAYTLKNSFRTQSEAGEDNNINLVGIPRIDLAGINITDNGGAFYVANGTAMNVNVADSALYLFQNKAGAGNDLYVENGGTFNLNLNSGMVTFESGIDGDGTLNIYGSGQSLVSLLLDNPVPTTFRMGEVNIGMSAGATGRDQTILWLERSDKVNDPRVTLETDRFNLTGSGQLFPAAMLLGDGIINASEEINVTNSGILAPTSFESIEAGNRWSPDTLTLKAPQINLDDFSLLYMAYGPQTSLTFGADGVAVSSNDLLNLEGQVNLGSGTVYFVTASGSPFAPGDYLVIRSDQSFDTSVLSNLTAVVDGFTFTPTANSPRGGDFRFLLGNDFGVSSGTNNIWFSQGLDSLTMDWTGGNTVAVPSGGVWDNGSLFSSLQTGAGDVHEQQFMTGDKVYISGDNPFDIELPAATLTSSIIVSGLVVGQNANGDLTDGGPTTISGDGGITAGINYAFGKYVGDTLIPTGKLEKYGNSILTFTNTGGNLFEEGIDLYGGTIAFDRVDQLAIGSGQAISFLGDSILQSNEDMTLPQKINILAGVSGSFDTNGYSVGIDGSISGGGDVAKNGAGTLSLHGANDYTGSTMVNAGTLEITGVLGASNGNDYAGAIASEGALVFNQSVDQTLSGVISGSGSLTKYGAGTMLTLTNANSFTGPLNIAAGTLVLGIDASLATSTMRLGEDAVFDCSAAAAAYNFKDLYVDGPNTSIKTNGDSAMFSGSGSTVTFTLPAGMDVNQRMLFVENGADITDSVIKVDNLSAGAANLKPGEKITLIKTEDGLVSNQDGAVVGRGGIAKLYYLIADNLNLYLGARANKQVKALSEGRLAGLSFVNQADLIWGPGMYAAMQQTERKGAGLVPFAASSGGSLRYDTGSHIDVDGAHILTGLAWRAPSSLVTGAFFEAGWGRYNSYNSFNNAPSVSGDGKASYYGVGVLGRYEVLGGIYGEASIRTGYASTDFSSRDISNSASSETRYDSGAMYHGAHVGAGYVWNIHNKARLDLSTKYIWLYMDDDSVTISGDKVQFQSVSSHRWRTGSRFSYMMDDYITPYAGTYFDYEFGGKAKARIDGDRIDAPNLKGGTGIGELGLIFKPALSLPLAIDSSVQGHVGTREGVTGFLRLTYMF
ncbi:MAG: autotransporter-associated beta strand repeat-containing protein [Alphaproteobacteria bacterium]|nr:autotransporter-associated beta strand repeat-containing protein [Alphaproteobacteria bacterium]